MLLSSHWNFLVSQIGHLSSLSPDHSTQFCPPPPFQVPFCLSKRTTLQNVTEIAPQHSHSCVYAIGIRHEHIVCCSILSFKILISGNAITAFFTPALCYVGELLREYKYKVSFIERSTSQPTHLYSEL